MTELNGCEPMKITVLGPYTFSIGDTSKLSPYMRGGIATQVKMPKKVSYKPLTEAIQSPEFVIFDVDNGNENMHAAFQALDIFQTREGRLPKPWSKTDAAIFLDITRNLISDDLLVEKFINRFSYVCYN